MIKKLSLVVAIAATLFSYGQAADTNTYTKSTSAANELVVSTNGFFLNKLPGGGYEPATLTITCVSDFRAAGAGNEPTFATSWIPIKNPGATGNAFAVNGGLTTANATTSVVSANANDGGNLTLRTRTWVLESINTSDVSLIAEGTGFSLRISAGGPLAIDKTGFPNTSIEVVEAYYPANYVAITEEQTAFASITRGETFTMTFKYTANTNISGLRYRILLVHPAGADTEADPYTNAPIDDVTLDDIVVTGTEEGQTGTVTFTFPEEEVLNGLSVGVTAESSNGTHKLNGNDYYGLQRYNNENSKWDFISYSLEFPVINAATLSSENVDHKNLAISQDLSSETVTIGNVSEIKTIIIRNILGQVVKTYPVQNTIDISSLNSGVYLLQTDNGLSQRIIKN